MLKSRRQASSREREVLGASDFEQYRRDGQPRYGLFDAGPQLEAMVDRIVRAEAVDHDVVVRVGFDVGQREGVARAAKLHRSSP